MVSRTMCEINNCHDRGIGLLLFWQMADYRLYEVILSVRRLLKCALDCQVNKAMQRIKKIVIFLVLTYVLGCSFLYLAQDKILFKPIPIEENARFGFGQERWFTMRDGVKLHGLFRSGEDSKGIILYLHGNRGNVRWCQGQANMFTGYGKDVLLVDYRGYGKSGGRIRSLQELYDDIQDIYDVLLKSYDEREIVVAGYSLGTGIASYISSVNNPSHLILVAPYVNILDLKNRILPFVPDFLVRYNLDNLRFLANVKCNVTILHGTSDEVIPYDSAQKLAQTYADKVSLVTLYNTGHRGAIFDSRIGAIMAQLAHFEDSVM